VSWSLALDKNHCWSSHPNRSWGNYYPYDMSYLTIHLIAALRWGFLRKIVLLHVIQKCHFLDPLCKLVEGRVSFCVKAKYCSTQTIYRTIMVDDINLTSPRDLSLATQWTLWVRVWSLQHLGLVWKTIFSMMWSSCLNINMSSDCLTQPKKFLDDKPVFHLEILKI
jgi:hypothetical protein